MRLARLLLPASLALLAACQAPAPVRPSATTGPRTRVSPTARPAATPTPAGTPAPDPLPAATQAPSVLDSPPVMATPGSPPSVTPAVIDALAGRRAALDAKLTVLAQSSFTAARTRLLQRDVGSRSTLLDNSGGIVSNNSGGLISDAGGGLLANNGAGLIGDAGGAYRLAQAAADPTVDVVPRGEEQAFPPILWPDGTSTVVVKKPGQSLVGRSVMLDEAKRPYAALDYLDATLTDTTFESGVTQTFIYPASGAFGLQLTSRVLLEKATGAGIRESGTARFRDPESDVAASYDRYAIDYKTRAATYLRRMAPYGLVEDGHYTYTDDRGLFFYFDDPLQRSPGGFRTTDAAGKALFAFEQVREDAGHVLVQTFDLLDGFTLIFRNDDRLTTQAAGRVLLDGVEVGGASRAYGADGSVTYQVKLADDPGKPVVAAIPAPPRVLPSPSLSGLDLVTTIAGSTTAEKGMKNGDGTVARFYGISGVLAASNDVVYASDSQNHRVVKLTRQAGKKTWLVETIAGGTEGTADGPGASATFNKPRGLGFWTVDAPNDTLLVSDDAADGGGRLRTIKLTDPAYPVVTVAGGDSAPGFADGEGAAARFAKPAGFAVTADGTAYLADENNRCIRRVRRGAGGVVSVDTLVGDAAAAQALVDGDAATARLWQPTDVAWDAPRKTLYVAERDGCAVRAIDMANPAAPMVRTVCRQSVPSFADGPVEAAGLGPMTGLAVDADGTLFLGDYGAKRVRLITPAGLVRSLAGRDLNGVADGPARMAYTGSPWGLDILPNGEIVYADNSGGRVVLITRAKK